jgi:hypothetical protein
VDDRELGLVSRHIGDRGFDKIRDLEWIANVQHGAMPGKRLRNDVHAVHNVCFLQDVEQRSPDLAHSRDDDCGSIHGYAALLADLRLK